LPAPSNDRNSNGGSGPFLLSPLLPSSSSSPRLRRVSDLPINTCLLSSRPKPTPSSCPWGAESTPKDAGRTPRFLRFQVKSREPTASALSSHSADFFLSFCGFLSFLAFTWMPCSNYGALLVSLPGGAQEGQGWRWPSTSYKRQRWIRREGIEEHQKPFTFTFTLLSSSSPS
jgi:hypothetical protein